MLSVNRVNELLDFMSAVYPHLCLNSRATCEDDLPRQRFLLRKAISLVEIPYNKDDQLEKNTFINLYLWAISGKLPRLSSNEFFVLHCDAFKVFNKEQAAKLRSDVPLRETFASFHRKTFY